MNAKKKLAQKLQDLAEMTTKNVVGKSITPFIYEPALPPELKEQLLKGSDFH